MSDTQHSFGEMKPFPGREYPINHDLLPLRSKRRSGLRAHPIRFLVAHDTGNPDSTAAGNVKYYKQSCNVISASAHIFVDDKQILECLPALTGEPEKAWHVLYNITLDNKLYGCNANDAAIGVEYCYGKFINAGEAYRRYVWVLAYACWVFKLNPKKAIIGHHVLDPGRKSDPASGLSKSQRSYEQLLRDVPLVYDLCTPKAPAPPVTQAEVGTLIAHSRLNIRYLEPHRSAESRIVEGGERLDFIGRVQGESINNNSQWYALENDEFCWSGAVDVAVDVLG